jgi:hypothetical protein
MFHQFAWDHLLVKLVMIGGDRESAKFLKVNDSSQHFSC